MGSIPVWLTGWYILHDPFAGTVLVDALGAVIPFTAVDGTISVFPRVPALGPIGGLLLVGLLTTAGAIARR